MRDGVLVVLFLTISLFMRLFMLLALRFFVRFLVMGSQTRGASLVLAWLRRRVQRRLIWASGMGI